MHGWGGPTEIPLHRKHMASHISEHCCGYLRRVTLRATFISPQHQETAGCTFAHLVDPQVQKKKKKKASYSMEFSKIPTVKVFRAK